MKIPPFLIALLALPACTYFDSPNGRFFSLDLPVETTHTVHKTVRVDAAPGTTVIMSESSPLDGYYRPVLNNGRRASTSTACAPKPPAAPAAPSSPPPAKTTAANIGLPRAATSAAPPTACA